MKRYLLILPVVLILMPIASGFAQSPVSVIDTLTIEIWPDYDRASVLVLLTGTLPGDSLLPASITLPLPEAARLNAVARIDGKNGNMMDDIFSSTDSPGALTFITPDLRFRVEYYLPYTTNESLRSFDYNWLATVSVNNFQLRVQRPSSASTLNTEPATANVVTSQDGFDYHTFPPRVVPAGQPFSLHVEYIMTTARLSASNMAPQNTGTQPPALPATPGTESGINWALIAVIAGGVLIFGALILQLVSRRSSANPGDHVDSRIKKPSRNKFCRDCGEAIDKGDRFCRGCGSEL